MENSDWKSGTRTLPSSHQIGDYVHFVVSYHSPGYLKNSVLWHGKVTKVHFDKGKVTYDLEFTVAIDNTNNIRHVTRVHNADSSLVISLEDWEKLEALRKDIEHESPFNHGGWHNSNEIPPKDEKEVCASVEVLCDVNGNRKEFRVGWYDFDDKEWRFHDTDRSWLEEEHLKWAYLPLA